METTGAMRFRFPAKMVIMAMTPDRRTPRLGLFETPYPLAKGVRNLKILSPDKD